MTQLQLLGSLLHKAEHIYNPATRNQNINVAQMHMRITLLSHGIVNFTEAPPAATCLRKEIHYDEDFPMPFERPFSLGVISATREFM